MTIKPSEKGDLSKYNIVMPKQENRNSKNGIKINN